MQKPTNYSCSVVKQQYSKRQITHKYSIYTPTRTVLPSHVCMHTVFDAGKHCLSEQLLSNNISSSFLLCSQSEAFKQDKSRQTHGE